MSALKVCYSILVLVPTLGGCTAQQETQTLSFITSGCVVADAEAAAGAAASKNTQVINGVTYACTDAAALAQLVQQVQGQYQSLKAGSSSGTQPVPVTQ